MRRFQIFLIPVLLFSILYSCKKVDGNDRNTVVPGRFRTLDEAIASAAPQARSTSIIVSTGATLVGPGGTLIFFPPNAFETLKGGKVTGSVNITFTDWIKRGDKIFGKVLPLNNGNILESAGEVSIVVTQNGEVLRIKKGLSYSIHFPQFGFSGPSYSGWVGRDFLLSSNTVNWFPGDPSKINVGQVGDTVYVTADTMHYIQAAESISVSNYHNFWVKIGRHPDSSAVVLEQSMGVILYDASKAIFPIQSANQGVIHAQNVPSKPMRIAVMGTNAGRFYGGVVAVPNPASDSTYTVLIGLTDPQSFRIKLNSYEP